jgi:hypothetical protein
MRTIHERTSNICLVGARASDLSLTAGKPKPHRGPAYINKYKQAVGEWNSVKRMWEIHYDRAAALRLKKRVA